MLFLGTQTPAERHSAAERGLPAVIPRPPIWPGPACPYGALCCRGPALDCDWHRAVPSGPRRSVTFLSLSLDAETLASLNSPCGHLTFPEQVLSQPFHALHPGQPGGPCLRSPMSLLCLPEQLVPVLFPGCTLCHRHSRSDGWPARGHREHRFTSWYKGCACQACTDADFLEQPRPLPADRGPQAPSLHIGSP